MRQRIVAAGARVAVLLGLCGLLAGPARATNGYFSHGYGVLYKGLGGAGVALPMSSLISATNPAGMVFLGNRYDVNLSIFNPNREYSVIGNPSGVPGTFGFAPGTVKSGSSWFVIPAFGANWMLAEHSSLG